MNKDKVRKVVLSLAGYQKRTTLLNILSTETVDLSQKSLKLRRYGLMHRNSVDVVSEVVDDDAVHEFKRVLSGTGVIMPVPVAIYVLFGQPFCVWAEGTGACWYAAREQILSGGGTSRQVPVELVASTPCQPQGVNVHRSSGRITGFGKEWTGVDIDIVEAVLKLKGERRSHDTNRSGKQNRAE